MHYSRLAAASQLFAAGLVVAGPVRRSTPSTIQSAGGYTFLGCAADPQAYAGSGYALTDSSTSNSNMTVENCASYCGASGYEYFGVEYYSQCFCGNTLQTGTTIEADTSNCTLACQGNSNEYCGGNWHIDLYGLPSAGSSSGSTTSSSAAVSTSTSTSISTSTTSAVATTASTTTTSAASSTATYAGTIQCPASNGTTYTTGGETFQIQCGMDHNGGDATNEQTNSMDDCVAACAAYSGCTDVAWVPGSPGTCYLKTSIVTGIANSNVWGAVLVSSSSSSSASSSVSSSTSSSTASSSTSTSVVPASTTSSSAASTSTSTSVAPASTTSTSSAVQTSSSSSTASPSSSSTSSVVKTSATSASSSVSSASSSSSASSTSTSSATTLKTSTTSSSSAASTSSKSSSTSTSTTSTAAAATATSTFFSLSSCSSLSVSLGSWLPLNYKYTPYYTGSGYTENSVNPGNLVPSVLPAQAYSIAGTNTACQAAQICLNNLKSLSVPYLSIDLHYVSTSSSWQCNAYSGFNVLSSYFNVPNSAVTHAYGFAGVLSL